MAFKNVSDSKLIISSRISVFPGEVIPEIKDITDKESKVIEHFTKLGFLIEEKKETRKKQEAPAEKVEEKVEENVEENVEEKVEEIGAGEETVEKSKSRKGKSSK